MTTVRYQDLPEDMQVLIFQFAESPHGDGEDYVDLIPTAFGTFNCCLRI